MNAATIRLSRLAALAVSALMLTGCATMSVGSYLARGLDLHAYHTFDWGPPDALSTGDPRLDNNRFFDERVRSQAERMLDARGFQRVTSGAPDLLIHYHVNISQDVHVSHRDRGDRERGGFDRDPYVYDAGTLVIDLVDPRTETLVWRGWATGSMEGAIDDQAWMDARIDEAVTRILERLPRAR
ncbi:MAG TPA: DUF4136 domain-containing protein [Gemmatimonadaceae bacterium]|nr:DUF4136 domain-containing protein [Vicinamibacterales bacterium]